MKNKLLIELTWRGILNNFTNETKLDYAMENNKAAYIGFDPSAKSLHLGNYAAIMLLRRFKSFGLKTIAVVGGATGMIGDPSGKSAERNLLDEETINENKKGIQAQLVKYANVDSIVDNYDHYKDMNFLTFLREIGKFINVNYLLEKEIIKSRLETGISYTEFTYTLIQGYDFAKLYKDHDVYVQAGGSDQWGNITTGCELVRKFYGDDSHASGITLNLLLKPDGTKFGKSEKGAIFLDSSLTSPYEMYQFLLNQEDAAVINLLKFLTELPQEEIQAIEDDMRLNPRERNAQKKLAEIIVKDIHGDDEYEKVLRISKALFTDNIISLTKEELMQTFNSIPSVDLEFNECSLFELLVNSKIASSNRDARDLINGNSIRINDEKLIDPEFKITKEQIIHDEFTVVKKGKRNYFILRWK
ncbi:MAG: tyrosine--tRNA ligase [Mycoplasma sp.]